MSDHCVVCGAEVPEGRQVCPLCGNNVPSLRNRVLATLKRCSSKNPNCIDCMYRVYREIRCVDLLMKDAITLIESEKGR